MVLRQENKKGCSEALKRISEWRVEINQGIPGIRNLGFPDYPKK
jgi:hypothetical protein